MGRKGELAEPTYKEEAKFLRETFAQFDWDSPRPSRPMIGIKLKNHRYRYPSSEIAVSDLMKNTCVEVGAKSLALIDHDCAIESEFVCEYSAPLDIKTMKNHDSSSEQCFGFMEELNTHTDVVAKCSKYAKSIGRIGKVAEPRNVETNYLLVDCLKCHRWGEDGSKSSWIGLTKASASGKVAYLSTRAKHIVTGDDLKSTICEINPELTTSCTQDKCFALSMQPNNAADPETTCQRIGISRNVIGMLLECLRNLLM